MKLPIATRVAILALSFLVGGCSVIQSHWPFQTGQNSQPEQTTLPPVATPPTSQAPPSVITGGKKLKRKKRHKKTGANPSGTGDQTPSNTSTPAQSATSAQGIAHVQSTSVTMEGNDADHSQAQALLDKANARLAQIDRSKVTEDTSAALQQASDLANAAHKAIDQGDYLAASSLARKASTLAEQVAARISSR